MHRFCGRAAARTESIIAAAIEVHRDKGQGLIESIYEGRRTREVELRRLKVITQAQVVIEYEGHRRETHVRFDLLVDDCVLVEEKGVQEVVSLHKAQVLSYMKILEVPAGLWLKFHAMKVVDGLSGLDLPGANM